MGRTPRSDEYIRNLKTSWLVDLMLLDNGNSPRRQELVDLGHEAWVQKQEIEYTLTEQHRNIFRLPKYKPFTAQHLDPQ